jgi:hypothetical protein
MISFLEAQNKELRACRGELHRRVVDDKLSKGHFDGGLDGGRAVVGVEDSRGPAGASAGEELGSEVQRGCVSDLWKEDVAVAGCGGSQGTRGYRLGLLA